MAEALYLNGVFEEVLDEIWAVHSVFPEQPLFLQPYADWRVTLLANHPPTADQPLRVFISKSADLAHVHCVGEVIGWFDKKALPSAIRSVADRIIAQFQPREPNVYDKGLNLIVIRRLVRLERPFPVGCLIVTSTGQPHAVRSQPGGWAFVSPNPVGVDLSAALQFRASATEFTEIPKAANP